MSSLAECEEMLRSFRCQDLANLLSYAGQSKNGKKSELYDRCLSILRRGNAGILLKIKEIHNSRIASTTNLSYNSLITAVNTNSNSSTSNSPDPTTMLNGRYGANSTSTNILPNQVLAAASAYTHNPQAYASQAVNFLNQMHAGLPGISSNPYSRVPAPVLNQLNNVAITAATLAHQHQINHQSSASTKIQFEKLAFYEYIAEIGNTLRLNGTNPSARPLSMNFSFSLNQEQVNSILSKRDNSNGRSEHTIQVHLRFGYFETSIQKDNLPANLMVNVNSKPAALPTPKPTSKPNADIIRPGRSIDITAQIRLAPNMSNRVDLNWTNLDVTKNHCVGVFLFKKVTVSSLVQYLKENCTKEAEVTRKMVREKLQISDSDFEIETNTYKVSLLCPLMKFRIQLPGRANNCKHVQCFDIESYLMMNEKKPTWQCPVCDQYTPFDNLIIDSLFKEILTKAGDGCEEIQFDSNAEWTKVVKEKEKPKSSSVTTTTTTSVCSNPQTKVENLEPCLENNKKEETLVDICDESFSSANGDTQIVNPPAKEANKPKEVFIDLTLDSDDEETRPNQPVLKQTLSSNLNESLNETELNPNSPSVSIISLSSSDSGGSRSQTPIFNEPINRNPRFRPQASTRQPLSVDTMRTHSSITSPVSSAGSVGSSNSSTIPNLSPMESRIITPPPINTPPDSSSSTSRLAREISSPNMPKQTPSLASMDSIINNTAKVSSALQRPQQQQQQQQQQKPINNNNTNSNHQQTKPHGIINSNNNKIVKSQNRQTEYLNKEKAMRLHEELRSCRSPNLMDTDSNANLNYRIKESTIGAKIANSLARIDGDLPKEKTNPIRPAQMNTQRPPSNGYPQVNRPPMPGQQINKQNSQQPFFHNNKNGIPQQQQQQQQVSNGTSQMRPMNNSNTPNKINHQANNLNPNCVRSPRPSHQINNNNNPNSNNNSNRSYQMQAQAYQQQQQQQQQHNHYSTNQSIQNR